MLREKHLHWIPSLVPNSWIFSNLCNERMKCCQRDINSCIKTTFKIDSSCCSRTLQGGFCNVWSADVWNCRNTLRHCQMAEREDYRRHADWMLLFAPKARWGLSIYVIWCLLWLLLYVWVVPVVWERGYYRVIQSEKSEKNWPLSIFFLFLGSIITTGLVTDDLGHFWTPGAPGGFWRTQNCPFLHGTNFGSEMFWVKTTCHTIFLIFWVKFGPKKAILSQNRVCKKCIFPKTVISNFAYIAPKHMLGTIF